MKLFKPLLFAACCFASTTHSATSQAFKDAAFTATAANNNVQYKCVEYAKSLDTFIKANATKFAIKSYAYYDIKNINAKTPNMTHDDYYPAS